MSVECSDLRGGVVVADVALPGVGGQEESPRHPVGQHRAGALGRRGAGQPGLILQITEGRLVLAEILKANT